MNVFIAGGAGFIGSHMAKNLVLDPVVNQVKIFDNFSSGSMHHINDIVANKKITVVDADIKHMGLLTHEMAGSDLVIHFAANPDIAKAVKQPDIDFWEGTYLTQNILEAMRINSVRRILYTSGSGVYGENADIIFNEGFGPCFPISTYGASKLACEALISSYCHMFEMIGRAFRFANVVGPLQTHGVGYDFIRKLKHDCTKLQILGDGSQSKAYIHVDDVLSAMLLVNKESMRSSKVFDVFNVATDDYVTVTEIADVSCSVAGLEKGGVEYIYTGGDRGWKGDVPKVLFDTSKIKSLGWRANRSSRQAISDSIKSMSLEIKDNKS